MTDTILEIAHEALITEQELGDLQKIMILKYGAYLKDRSFTISHTNDKQDIHCSITLENPQGTFVYKVEAAVSKKNLALKDKEALLVMLDYIDIYFDEYLKGEENVYIPIDWTDYTFENLTFKMRGQVRNRKAEDLADELLGEK